MEVTQYLHQMIAEGITFDQSGEERKATGTISLSEAEFITELVQDSNARIGVETGVAFGASALAICESLRENQELDSDGVERKLYGVDPCQFDEHGGAAIAALDRCGLGGFFELMEGPSHTMIPKLIEQGIEADFVFVDGMHTFDYSIVDVFLADKILKVGGYLLMHDFSLPSKKKVWRYLHSYRDYVRIAGPKLPVVRKVLSSGNLARKGELRHAALKLLTRSNLAVLRKVSQFEPPHTFFANF